MAAGGCARARRQRCAQTAAAVGGVGGRELCVGGAESWWSDLPAPALARRQTACVGTEATARRRWRGGGVPTAALFPHSRLSHTRPPRHLVGTGHMAGVAVAAVAAAEGRADNNNARCRWRHCARRWHHPFTLAAATWLATGARRALTCSASGSLHGVHQTRGPGGAARKPEACACTCECRRVCHVCVVYYRYDCDEAGNRCSCSNRRGSSCCTVTTGVTAAAAPVCRCCCCTNLYCSRSRCLNSESSRHSHSKRQKQQYEKRTTHQCGARHCQAASYGRPRRSSRGGGSSTNNHCCQQQQHPSAIAAAARWQRQRQRSQSQGWNTRAP